MFSTILQSTTDGSIQVSDAIICLIMALVLGGVISATYMYTNRKRNTSNGLAISLIVLPAIVTVIIMLVGTETARALSIAGAFTLVRFRSVPGESKDITYIFLAMALGLASGMGFLLYGAVIVAIVCLTLVGLSFTKLSGDKKNNKILKIVLPEDLNYEEAFDEPLKKYTIKNTLERVKTINMGTLYELTYNVSLRDDISEKEFIDELRCRNGNLNISLLLSGDVATL